MTAASFFPSLPAECNEIRMRALASPFKPSLLLDVYRDRKDGLLQRTKGYEHFVGCESCLEWLGEQVEKRYFIRAKDAAEYCCLSMYMAVEETDPGKEVIPGSTKEKVRFRLFRGEDPEWTIGSKGCVINFCPWCGKILLNSRFRNPKK